MKTITRSFSGLASSLLLNVGLVQLAEKLEPMGVSQTEVIRDPRHCGQCFVCNFPARARG
jgi:hypothetical protein